MWMPAAPFSMNILVSLAEKRCNERGSELLENDGDMMGNMMKYAQQNDIEIQGMSENRVSPPQKATV